MSQPTFTKSGVTTYTFDKARTFPVSEPVGGQQIVDEAGSGQPKVADLGAEEQFINVKARNLSATNISALLTFFRDSLINWSANNFTWTDEDSNTNLVRYMNSKGILDPKEDNDDKFSVIIRLKVEIL